MNLVCSGGLNFPESISMIIKKDEDNNIELMTILSILQISSLRLDKLEPYAKYYWIMKLYCINQKCFTNGHCFRKEIQKFSRMCIISKCYRCDFINYSTFQEFK